MMPAKKLGFGCMRLPLTDPEDFTKVDIAQVERMVDTFLERGFTYFDTAYMYHEFESEKIMRRTLVERHRRDSFTLASKLPTMFLKAEGDQERIFAEQLEKCGVGYFDYYLLHNLNVSNYRKVEQFDSFAFAARMKAEGKIRHVGFSFHDSAELLDEILTAHPETEFVQLQINYMDWDDESIQSRKCYETARATANRSSVMEPVKGGTTGPTARGGRTSLPHAPARPLARLVGHPLRGRTGGSDDGAERHVDDGAAGGQHLLHAGFQTAGRRRTGHGGNGRRHHQPLDRHPCTACRYCVDGCPKKIAIPEYFALYNNVTQSLNKGFAVQEVYYANLTQTHGRASECIACRKCEKSCPQHLPIVEHLRQVSAKFDGPAL